MYVIRDATAQTHLTGDRLILLDDVKWKWGEIPETTPPHKSPNVRRMSSRSSQTPLTITSSITDHQPDTGIVAVSEEEYGLEQALQPSACAGVEQTSEQIAANALEPVDCESERQLAESKPVTDSNNIYTPGSQPAGSNNTADSQIIEPLPETKKGQ